MNTDAMEKLIAHFERCFGQETDTVLHSTAGTDPHIDVLVFAPTQKYPFWKLCTMGASDCKMPKREGVRYGKTASPYNEYVMFLDPSLRVEKDSDDWKWYWKVLMETALFPFRSGEALVATDTVDLGLDGPMKGVVLLFPEAVEDTSVLRCRLGLGKTAVCLQVMPVTSEEMDERLRRGDEGGDWLYERFYAHDPGTPDRFLAQTVRVR